ncbi:MAG TPA: RNA 2',3'-cyclic phosphodiesterase [Smithellaceae bacterium]|nr:RNA 2',3'-cyclic phosphodiesterase [Smithellaceae bacterium]HQC11517.1 RNA 2',3'-cyclic phosphodiesterase [Smithellaceae bacterium]
MSNSEKNIRAFLAVEPPEEILQTVIRLQEKLKREISGRLSWTRPGGQHLTLKFFGDVSTGDVDSIGRAVQNRLPSGAALNLKIEKLGVFPDARKPRVLWCGTSGDVEKLAALHKQLDADFTGIGFPKEDRPFRAHLTLARIKDPRAPAGIDKALQKYLDFSTGVFFVRELILFQSKLTPQGALYTRLATFPLES